MSRARDQLESDKKEKRRARKIFGESRRRNLHHFSITDQCEKWKADQRTTLHKYLK